MKNQQTKQSKPRSKKSAKKAPETDIERSPAPEEPLIEHIDEVAEEILFGKNQARSYVLRDVWMESLNEVVNDKSVPVENRSEIMFLTLSNALLDMVMDIVPDDMAIAFARNLDDYLTVTVINKEYDIDLLKTFQEEFMEAAGKKFQTEEQLTKALSEFEQKWWDEPRKDLKGKSPNEALEDAAERYNL